MCIAEIHSGQLQTIVARNISDRFLRDVKLDPLGDDDDLQEEMSSDGGWSDNDWSDDDFLFKINSFTIKWQPFLLLKHFLLFF